MTTPKAQFQQDSSTLKAFGRITDDPVFAKAVQVALAHFVHCQSAAPDAATAAANAYRLEGAKSVVETLLTMGVVVSEPPRPTTPNLNHRT